MHVMVLLQGLKSRQWVLTKERNRDVTPPFLAHSTTTIPLCIAECVVHVLQHSTVFWACVVIGRSALETASRINLPE